MMTSRGNGNIKRSEKPRHKEEVSPNWVIIVGGALLSTLSIRLCYKLKQAFETKRSTKTHPSSKDNGKPIHNKRHESCKLHSQFFRITQCDNASCYQYATGISNDVAGAKCMPISPTSKNGDNSLPLVRVPSTHSIIDNSGTIQASLLDRLDPPLNLFNGSDSPCISESGSDIYSKREVVQKLQQQIRRRDDMIMEMQEQIADLQNSLKVQMACATHLQSQLDSSYQELFDSEREIQRIRKVIANHCARKLPPHDRNGHAGGHFGDNDNAELLCDNGEADRIDMLRKSVREMKEAIEGRDFSGLTVSPQASILNFL